MPGRHINDQQVRLYMTARLTRPQTTAAAMAGISVATGRRIERKPRPPSAHKKARQYRTRTDPLEGLWDEAIVPMLDPAGGRRQLRENATAHHSPIGLSSYFLSTSLNASAISAWRLRP